MPRRGKRSKVPRSFAKAGLDSQGWSGLVFSLGSRQHLIHEWCIPILPINDRDRPIELWFLKYNLYNIYIYKCTLTQQVVYCCCFSHPFNFQNGGTASLVLNILLLARRIHHSMPGRASMVKEHFTGSLSPTRASARLLQFKHQLMTLVHNPSLFFQAMTPWHGFFWFVVVPLWLMEKILDHYYNPRNVSEVVQDVFHQQ